jgi:hypothetical protein
VTRPVLSVVVVAIGVAVFAAVLLLRRSRPELKELDTGPASSVLGFVAAAFGILIGFVIAFLLGQASSARQATGDEATSIGTAFDYAQLFPEGEPGLQHALICYSRAVTEEEWPVLPDGRSAPEADVAYRDLIAAYGEVDEPLERTFQAGAATNSFAQIGSISTARETRLVTAQGGVHVPVMLLLMGSAALVLMLLFVTTLAARPLPQALLLGAAGTFASVLLMLVVVLNNPFTEGLGPVTPGLIEDNTARMVALAPDAAAQPCSYEDLEG